MALEKPKSNITTTDSVDHKLLEVIEALPSGSVDFEQIIKTLGARSFAYGILVFSLPMILPMPPGVPMAAGIVISVFALQFLARRSYVWMPAWIMRKSIDKNSLVKAHLALIQYFGWLFKVSKSRLEDLTGIHGAYIGAILFLILGILMVLPIPIIGNVLPALACTILAIGLINNDGLVYVIGLITSFIAISSSVLMALGAFTLLQNVF